MIAYRNILYGTDYSEDAELAFCYAVDLAQRYRATLHILHVLKSLHRYLPTEVYQGMDTEVMLEASPALVAKATRELEEHYRPRLEGIKEVRFTVAVGTPFVEILRYARDHQIDLIVVGTVGTSEFIPTHYGSTVDQVSRRAQCPVMAIRNPEKTYTL